MTSFLRNTLSSPKSTFWAAGSLLLWAPALIFVTDNVVELAHVRGASMNPAFNTPPPSEGATGTATSNPLSRDTVLLYKWRPGEHVRRGDVVAYWSPRDPEKMAIKRVVAVENDSVQTRSPYPFRTETVPVGHVWVEGDNPEGRFSLDSNDFGPLSRSLITGTVKARLWPNPTMIRSDDWEASANARKNGRIRRGVSTQAKAEVYTG